MKSKSRCTKKKNENLKVQVWWNRMYLGVSIETYRDSVDNMAIIFSLIPVLFSRLRKDYRCKFSCFSQLRKLSYLNTPYRTPKMTVYRLNFPVKSCKLFVSLQRLITGVVYTFDVLHLFSGILNFFIGIYPNRNFEFFHWNSSK